MPQTILSPSESIQSLNPLGAEGNSLAEAYPLGVIDLTPHPQTFSGGVGSADPKDFYRFGLQAKTQVTVTLAGLSTPTPIFLADAQGKLLTSSNSGANPSVSLSRELNPGIYYLQIGSRTQTDTTYNLELSARFLPQDQIVSNPAVSLNDPEYDAVGNRITWQDGRGNLWVAPVSAATGDFLLDEAVLIDSGLAPFTAPRNGPEWVYSQNGSEIVYTKRVGDDSFLGRARWDGSQWQAGFLTDATGQPIAGSIPFGSLNPGDPSPLVNYNISGVGPAWLELNNPSVGGLLSGMGGRWVEGEPAILRFREVDGQPQVFKDDVYTGIQTQLTFDQTARKTYAYMWRAPEFNNELVFFTGEVLEGAPKPSVQQLGIYRQIEGQWVKIKTIQSPSAELPFINSAEPFVYNGRSYISLGLNTEEPNGKMSIQGSQMWIFNIDPHYNFSRQVSQDGGLGRNNDPESFITEAGAFIYYTEIISGQPVAIRRADTGLGLPDIIGTPTADILIGTPRGDRLIGGLGKDTLTGGDGQDLFVYQQLDDGLDTITDFTVGEDRIDLRPVFAGIGYQGTQPAKDGYLQILNSSVHGGALVRIDPDGKLGTEPFSHLLVLAGVDATLVQRQSILF